MGGINQAERWIVTVKLMVDGRDSLPALTPSRASPLPPVSWMTQDLRTTRTLWERACSRRGQNISAVFNEGALQSGHLLLHTNLQLLGTFQQLRQQRRIFIHIAFVLRQVSSLMTQGE